MPAVKPPFPTLQRAQLLSTGLVLGMPLYEGSGTSVNDLSGLGNNGSVQGASPWAAGQSGWCLRLNGSTNYVRIAGQGNGLPLYAGVNFSVALWCQPTSLAGNQSLWAEGSSSSTSPLYSLQTSITTSTKVRLFVRNDAGATLASADSTQAPFAAGVWTHVCLTDAGGVVVVYLNGVADAANFNYTRGTLTLNQSAAGALWRSTAAQFYNGAVDGLVAYDRVLAPAEVGALYRDSWATYRRRPWRLKAAAGGAALWRRTLYGRAGSRGVS